MKNFYQVRESLSPLKGESIIQTTDFKNDNLEDGKKKALDYIKIREKAIENKTYFHKGFVEISEIWDFQKIKDANLYINLLLIKDGNEDVPEISFVFKFPS